jgi:hypothetical protein
MTLTGFVLWRSRTALISRLRVDRDPLVTTPKDSPAHPSTQGAPFGKCTKMADYYSVLAKAVEALDPNTATARQQLYERARSAMIAKLEGDAAIPGSAVAAAKIALESAIVRVEAEVVVREPTPVTPSAVGRNLPAGRPARTGRDTWLTEVLERASCGTKDEQDFAPKGTRSGDG